MIKIIKIFENDYDYDYENYMYIKCNKEDSEKISKDIVKKLEEIKDLDCEEREEKYGEQSIIVAIEEYISNNYDLLNEEDYSKLELDCY